MKLSDIKIGDCWRFTDPAVSDRVPAITTRISDFELKGLPKNWEDYGLMDPPEKHAYYQEHKDHTVELLEHYATHPCPTPKKLLRRDLVDGDCFHYDNSPSRKFVVAQGLVHGLPSGWEISTKGTACSTWERRVFRIPHWKIVTTSQQAEETCDGLQSLREEIRVLHNQRVDGVRGEDCFTRFEQAQRTESIARQPGSSGYVSTNADCSLTTEQVEHARDIWRLALKLRVLENNANTVAHERRSVCDDVDEMPNMTYVTDATNALDS